MHYLCLLKAPCNITALAKLWNSGDPQWSSGSPSTCAGVRLLVPGLWTLQEWLIRTVQQMALSVLTWGRNQMCRIERDRWRKDPRQMALSCFHQADVMKRKQHSSHTCKKCPHLESLALGKTACPEHPFHFLTYKHNVVPWPTPVPPSVPGLSYLPSFSYALQGNTNFIKANN